MAGEQLASAGLSAIVVIAMHSAALAGPGIATNWAETTWTQEQCFARAEATLTELGFATIESSKFSRFAQTGEYTLMVQCMTEKNLILFVTAGPSRADVQKYQAQLFGKF
jgi:hypothetical protein